MSNLTPTGLMMYVPWETFPHATQQAIVDALKRHSEPSPRDTESYPLTLPQARQLIDGIDEKTADFIRQLVEKYDETNFEADTCWISYADAWKIVGVNDKNAFAKQVHSGLHRRLRNVIGKKEQLVLAYDKGGDDGLGAYYIDSLQAVQSLREVFKLK